MIHSKPDYSISITNYSDSRTLPYRLRKRSNSITTLFIKPNLKKATNSTDEDSDNNDDRLVTKQPFKAIKFIGIKEDTQKPSFDFGTHLLQASLIKKETIEEHQYVNTDAKLTVSYFLKHMRSSFPEI